MQIDSMPNADSSVGQMSINLSDGEDSPRLEPAQNSNFMHPAEVLGAGEDL